MPEKKPLVHAEQVNNAGAEAHQTQKESRGLVFRPVTAGGLKLTSGAQQGFLLTGYAAGHEPHIACRNLFQSC